MNHLRKDPGWFAHFLREVFSMPPRHMLVFLAATILLVVVEVELTDGWHLVPFVELIGSMVFLYLLWAAWRVRDSRRTKQ